MYTYGLWLSHLRYAAFEWGALWGNPDLGMTPINPNYPPSVPELPSGPIEGQPGIEYDFSSHSNDPNEDSILYLFNWGDWSNSDGVTILLWRDLHPISRLELLWHILCKSKS